MKTYRTIVADPPWRFRNHTGKSGPEHHRLFRYPTMNTDQICAMGPTVFDLAEQGAHLYLWVPTALLNWGLQVVAAWGFDFKTAVYWHKVTKAGDTDRSGMGFYYRNVIEPCLFATRGSAATNLNNVPNLVEARKTGHSIKPGAFYEVVERQSDPAFLELFARAQRPGWDVWGNEVQGAVLITTDVAALGTWRETIGSVMESLGQAQLRDIYRFAEQSPKVRRSKRLGHHWQAQIRRTLQEHFKPAGYGIWRTV